MDGGRSSPLPTIALIAQINLLIAILPRQQWMINAAGWVATRPPTRWPLRVRWALGKYYHLGGLHVGGAVAGTVWYVAFLAGIVREWVRGNGVSTVNVVVSAVIAALFVGMCVMASPRRRARAHDHFEVTHRFCGWIALGLVWVNTSVFVAGRRGDDSIARALLASPTAWLLLLSTLGAAWPWLLLRRVPITVSHPSAHAAIVDVHHHQRVPVGTTRAISRRPFVGWHHFANVPARAGSDGYRMLISRAGDWTSDFIDDPPRHVWVRGVPAVGVANVKRLFPKVVYVVTGSGIGPALGHLLADATPARLVWVTRDPRRTYGDGLVDEVVRAQPDATIWNTDLLGKPDVVRLAYAAFRDSGADAVICISNKSVTWKVVHEFERAASPPSAPSGTPEPHPAGRRRQPPRSRACGERRSGRPGRWRVRRRSSAPTRSRAQRPTELGRHRRRRRDRRPPRRRQRPPRCTPRRAAHQASWRTNRVTPRPGTTRS